MEATRGRYAPESNIVALIASYQIAGKRVSVEDVDRLSKTLNAKQTGAELIEKAKAYTHGEICESIKKALNSKRPDEALNIIARAEELAKSSAKLQEVKCLLTKEEEEHRERMISLCFDPSICRLAIATIMLLVALADMPYVYYQILRIVLTVIAGIAAFSLFGKDIKHAGWIAVVIAVTYNPLVPFRMERESWEVINMLTILALAYVSIRDIKSKTPKLP
jgi:hypothetical protein